MLRVLTKPTQPRNLFALSLAVGLALTLTVFDLDFLTGRSPFWLFPQGVIPGSDDDMAEAFAGYLYFLRSPWHIPLFFVPSLGFPTGASILYTDSLPIVALAGKCIHALTGALPNLFGLYIAACFCLSGVAMTAVLILANVTSIAAMLVATVLADCMPALLWRWGHVGPQAHFLLIGSIALYVWSARHAPSRHLRTVWTIWLVACMWTSQYFFVLSGLLWAASLLQRPSREGMTRDILQPFVTIFGVAALSGQFGPGAGLPFSPSYGAYSMNLLSPFVPQFSGLLPGLGGAIDATHGQYEGFNYLGAGVLLVTVAAAPSEISWLRTHAKAHRWLLAILLLCTLFAVSHRVFVGPHLLLDLHLPGPLVSLLGIFRASGRFFWLVAYVHLALALILLLRRPKPWQLALAACAVLLQLVDTQPLRDRITASLGPGTTREVLDATAVARATDKASAILIWPSVACTEHHDAHRANVELHLLGARQNVPVSSVFLSRHVQRVPVAQLLRDPTHASALIHDADARFCQDEGRQLMAALQPGMVVFLLSNGPDAEHLRATRSDLDCARQKLGWSCQVNAAR